MILLKLNALSGLNSVFELKFIIGLGMFQHIDPVDFLVPTTKYLVLSKL